MSFREIDYSCLPRGGRRSGRSPRETRNLPVIPLLMMSRVLWIGPRGLFEKILFRPGPLPRKSCCSGQASSQRRVMILRVLRRARCNLSKDIQRCCRTRSQELSAINNLLPCFESHRQSPSIERCLFLAPPESPRASPRLRVSKLLYCMPFDV